MSISFLQAFLIGCVAALTQIDGDWLGEAKLREPVMTGFLVGVILGDITNGLIIGGSLELMWMAANNIGPTANLDVGTGGTIGAAVALATGSSSEIAVTFAIPVALLMQMVNMLKMTLMSGLMLKADSYIDDNRLDKTVAIHYLCGVITFLIYWSFTFVFLYVGGDLIDTIVNGIPAWLQQGLSGVAKVLPAMGYAMLLNVLWDVRLTPYFAIGFVLAAYMNVSMIGVCIISVAIAAVVYILKSDILQVKTNVATTGAGSVTDEWED